MRRILALVTAVAGGLVLAWFATLIGAEAIRTLLGAHFARTDWPAWFPTTPVVLVTLALWVVFGRAIWRGLSRQRARRA